MMNRLRRSLSFRKKNKSDVEESEDWKDDEQKVRDGDCCFPVKYLGCIEVLEGTGLRTCEEAMKQLHENARKSERMSFRRKRKTPSPVLALLYVSGSSLRLVEHNSFWQRIPALKRDDSQGLIIDQAVEKVSFCAPDRQHLKAFSYICRDGVTRRWMCHGFVSLRDSGDRLSHAIGCAFGVCLEKKQQREMVQAMYNDDRTSFVRQGSFKPASITERMNDPQAVKVTEPPSPSSSDTSSEISGVPRPRPNSDLRGRKNSLAEFPKLNGPSCAFKRGTSLRLDQLPSTLRRQKGDAVEPVKSEEDGQTQRDDVSSEWDPITAFCQRLTQGLLNIDHVDCHSSLPQGSTVQMDCMPATDVEPTQMVSSDIRQPSLSSAMTVAASNNNPFVKSHLPPYADPFGSNKPNMEFVINV